MLDDADEDESLSEELNSFSQSVSENQDRYGQLKRKYKILFKKNEIFIANTQRLRESNMCRRSYLNRKADELDHRTNPEKKSVQYLRKEIKKLQKLVDSTNKSIIYHRTLLANMNQEIIDQKHYSQTYSPKKKKKIHELLQMQKNYMSRLDEAEEKSLVYYRILSEPIDDYFIEECRTIESERILAMLTKKMKQSNLIPLLEENELAMIDLEKKISKNQRRKKIIQARKEKNNRTKESIDLIQIPEIKRVEIEQKLQEIDFPNVSAEIELIDNIYSDIISKYHNPMDPTQMGNMHEIHQRNVENENKINVKLEIIKKLQKNIQDNENLKYSIQTLHENNTEANHMFEDLIIKKNKLIRRIETIDRDKALNADKGSKIHQYQSKVHALQDRINEKQEKINKKRGKLEKEENRLIDEERKAHDYELVVISLEEKAKELESKNIELINFIHSNSAASITEQHTGPLFGANFFNNI